MLAAIAEFDRLGRVRFLEENGFGSARSYFLEYSGQLYDSKAIVGVAHGISGDRPWRAEDFSGGDRSVGDTLRQLGFRVRFIRNPPWSRDEIILACALVEANGWRTIAQEDARAIELSQLLQTHAIHPLHTRGADFRNPAGVERKTSDIVSRHPGYRGRPTNGNRLDTEVLQDFLRDPARMSQQAQAIRAALASWDDLENDRDDQDVDTHPGAEEGGVLLRIHLRRERDPRLKRDKIKEAKRRGARICCEVCGFDFHHTYGERGFEYIECHHRTPLAITGAVHTQLADLAMICSNCHRMIHRSRQWITIEELRALIRPRIPTTD